MANQSSEGGWLINKQTKQQIRVPSLGARKTKDAFFGAHIGELRMLFNAV